MITLRWPTDYAVVTQPFGVRPEAYRRFGLPGHEGLDIRAPHGANIYACAAGTVKAVLNTLEHAYGIHVRIQHAGGYETIYAHLQRATVSVGQVVAARQIIGRADSTGNSSASHLHLTLKKAGATVRGETSYPNDIIDPTPYLVRPGKAEEAAPSRWAPDHPLRGLHDGAEWMLANGARGWAVEPLYSGDALHIVPTLDYSRHAAAGVRVIVRLNYSYATVDGGGGTYPARARRDEWVQWCLRTIRASKGVWGWIVGNEPNRAAERPRDGSVISPADVTYLYNAIWYNARVEDRISPPAIDPTNYESGDPREYWRQIVADLLGAEFFALHGYSYTHRQAVDSALRFGAPMQWQYYSFRMWEPLAAVLYADTRWRRLPLVISEANHLYIEENGGATGWHPEASGWIESVYDYVRRWNAGPGEQYVHGVCLYRLAHDSWRLDEHPQLLATLGRVGG